MKNFKLNLLVFALVALGTASLSFATPKHPNPNPAARGQTVKNLTAAFEGETRAFSKYSQYSKAADREGYGYVANLFRAAARAEEYHAQNHKRVLDSLGVTVSPSKYTGDVEGTLANLENAVKGEAYENTRMYPEFIATAKAEKSAAAVKTFTYAMSAEKTHQRFYVDAIAKIKSGAKMQISQFYVCTTCGETFAGTTPGTCPICGNSKSKFILIK